VGVHLGRGGTRRGHERGVVVKLKEFLVDALGSALELGIATPDDVLRHVTPDVLAQALPRPLWARLITACLGAPRVDAQLVVETIGVPNLCEHVPSATIWAVVADIGGRSLGQAVAPVVAAPERASGVPVATPARASAPLVSPPPEAAAAVAHAAPPAPAPVGPSIPAPVNQPLADLINELESDERPITPTRGRAPASQRFRASSTATGRLGAREMRRPQAQVPAPAPAPARHSRRGATEVTETDTETSVDGGDWRESLAVEDSQLVDWQATEETQTSNDDYPRKR
jgi:hypothetical protein